MFSSECSDSDSKEFIQSQKKLLNDPFLKLKQNNEKSGKLSRTKKTIKMKNTAKDVNNSSIKKLKFSKTIQRVRENQKTLFSLKFQQASISNKQPSILEIIDLQEEKLRNTHHDKCQYKLDYGYGPSESKIGFENDLFLKTNNSKESNSFVTNRKMQHQTFTKEKTFIFGAKNNSVKNGFQFEELSLFSNTNSQVSSGKLKSFINTRKRKNQTFVEEDLLSDENSHSEMNLSSINNFQLDDVLSPNITNHQIAFEESVSFINTRRRKNQKVNIDLNSISSVEIPRSSSNSNMDLTPVQTSNIAERNSNMSGKGPRIVSDINVSNSSNSKQVQLLLKRVNMQKSMLKTSQIDLPTNDLNINNPAEDSKAQEEINYCRKNINNSLETYRQSPTLFRRRTQNLDLDVKKKGRLYVQDLLFETKNLCSFVRRHTICGEEDFSSEENNYVDFSSKDHFPFNKELLSTCTNLDVTEDNNSENNLSSENDLQVEELLSPRNSILRNNSEEFKLFVNSRRGNQTFMEDEDLSSEDDSNLENLVSINDLQLEEDYELEEVSPPSNTNDQIAFEESVSFINTRRRKNRNFEKSNSTSVNSVESNNFTKVTSPETNKIQTNSRKETRIQVILKTANEDESTTEITLHIDILTKDWNNNDPAKDFKLPEINCISGIENSTFEKV